jgi:hypothetical protein
MVADVPVLAISNAMAALLKPIGGGVTGVSSVTQTYKVPLPLGAAKLMVGLPTSTVPLRLFLVEKKILPATAIRGLTAAKLAMTNRVAPSATINWRWNCMSVVLGV